MSTHEITSVWSSHGHRFIGEDDDYVSCLTCGAMYQLVADVNDPTRGAYVNAWGDEPQECSHDTSMAHGYPGERDEGTPQYPHNVDHSCNCLQCDS